MRESGVLYKHARLKKLVALTTIQPSSPSGIPDMLASKEREQVEQEDTVEQAENDKAPGKHGIEMESLKAGDPTLWTALAVCFSRYTKELCIPKQ